METLRIDADFHQQKLRQLYILEQAAQCVVFLSGKCFTGKMYGMHCYLRSRARTQTVPARHARAFGHTKQQVQA